jgi:hypothetical protein
MPHALKIGFVLAAFAAATAAQDPSLLALGGLDPVRLGEGKEVAGDPGITAQHYLYLYRFIDATSRERFLSDPERYGIQMGGGCGRMGPASGKGDPERFAVHDGRIYLFASDACRTGFLKRPELFLDPDEKPATGDAAASRRAGELLDAAEKAHGIARLRAARALRLTRIENTKVDGGEREDGRRETIRFPGDVRVESWWGPSRFIEVDAAAGSFEINSKGESTTRHATASRDVRRSLSRRPLLLLRERGKPGFVAFRSGEGKVGADVVEFVTISYDGMTTTLGVDPKSGTILSARHRARGRQYWFVDAERRFLDHRDVGGVRFPFRIETIYEGQEDAKAVAGWTAIELDPDGAADEFRRPR